MEPLAEAWRAAWEPPDNRPIVEWAAENINLPIGGYAIPGHFHIEKSRHLIAVFEALEDDERRMVNVLKATQTGGSLCADIFVPWVLDNHAGPVMWNWHTDQMAAQHAEVRAMPVIRNCPRLARLLPDDRHKARNQEIIFKNGVPLFIQGPSDGNLQGKSIRYLINDECWQWKPGRLREALGRITQYKKVGTSKVLNISQAGTVGDDWHKLTEGGDFYEWEVACPHCGVYQALQMEERIAGESVYRMQWDEDGSNVRYICAGCSQAIYDSDATKAAFNATGRYRLTRPGKDRQTVTFHWSSLIWLPWVDLVKEYRDALAAKKVGALLPLKAFMQKILAAFWDEREMYEASNVQIRFADYKPAEDWPLEKFRFLTVDCQRDFMEFWAVVRAWGNGESRRLWRGRLTSWEHVRQIQVDWKVRSQFVAVDSGYRASEVYRQCCRYVDETGRGWVAMKGSPRVDFTHNFPDKPSEQRVYSERNYGDTMLGLKFQDVEQWLASVSPSALKLYRLGKLRCPLYLWSNPSVKDITANLRDGRGVPWLAPMADKNTFDESIYRKQLAGELKMPGHDSHGHEKAEWHQIGDNHFWDCENMQTVCAILTGVLPLPALN